MQGFIKRSQAMERVAPVLSFSGIHQLTCSFSARAPVANATIELA
jgi:hypothetical protein